MHANGVGIQVPTGADHASSGHQPADGRANDLPVHIDILAQIPTVVSSNWAGATGPWLSYRDEHLLVVLDSRHKI